MSGLMGGFRAPLSTLLGDELKKREVWNKGHVKVGYDAAVYRQDDFSFWICFNEYGNRTSDYG